MADKMPQMNDCSQVKLDTLQTPFTKTIDTVFYVPGELLSHRNNGQSGRNQLSGSIQPVDYGRGGEESASNGEGEDAASLASLSEPSD
jgi:hypothetical protein